jgi:hypothetical protein
MAKRSGGNPESYTFPSWREPKQRHQRMVNRMLQLNAHLIACFRAKEKLKMMEVEERGRKVKRPVPQGIQPIMEENLPYEMTFFAILHPDEPGVPHWSHKALMEGLHPIFRDTRQIDEQLGLRLAEWAVGGASRPATPQASNDGEAPKRDTSSFWARESYRIPLGKAGLPELQDRIRGALNDASTAAEIDKLWADCKMELELLKLEVKTGYDLLEETRRVRRLQLLDAEELADQPNPPPAQQSSTTVLAP